MSLMKRLKLVKKRASLSTYYSLWGSLVYLGEVARSSSHILRSGGFGQYALNIVLSIHHHNFLINKLCKQSDHSELFSNWIGDN